MEALADKNLDKAKEINAREKIIDYLSSEITDYLVEVNRYELPLADSRRIGALFHVVIDLERIGDHAVNIAEWVEYSITGVHRNSASHTDNYLTGE